VTRAPACRSSLAVNRPMMPPPIRVMSECCVMDQLGAGKNSDADSEMSVKKKEMGNGFIVGVSNDEALFILKIRIKRGNLS
jgi:hypothetical protein